MALDLLVPLGNHAFLGFQLFGLLGQAAGRGIDLARLLIHFGLAPFETRLPMSKGAFHLD